VRIGAERRPTAHGAPCWQRARALRYETPAPVLAMPWLALALIEKLRRLLSGPF
jgi:hypothetical protein